MQAKVNRKASLHTTEQAVVHFTAAEHTFMALEEDKAEAHDIPDEKPVICVAHRSLSKWPIWTKRRLAVCRAFAL